MIGFLKTGYIYVIINQAESLPIHNQLSQLRRKDVSFVGKIYLYSFNIFLYQTFLSQLCKKDASLFISIYFYIKIFCGNQGY